MKVYFCAFLLKPNNFYIKGLVIMLYTLKTTKFKVVSHVPAIFILLAELYLFNKLTDLLTQRAYLYVFPLNYFFFFHVIEIC